MNNEGRHSTHSMDTSEFLPGILQDYVKYYEMDHCVNDSSERSLYFFFCECSGPTVCERGHSRIPTAPNTPVGIF